MPIPGMKPIGADKDNKAGNKKAALLARPPGEEKLILLDLSKPPSIADYHRYSDRPNKPLGTAPEMQLYPI